MTSQQNNRFKTLAGLPTPCDRFSAQVQEWFAYLFHEHGFAIIHEDRPSKYNCLLGLESNVCRLQIYRTEEEGNVWIARRDAPFGWAAHTRQEGSRWYPLEAVLAFVYGRNRRELEWWWKRSKEEILSLLAAELRPVAPQVMTMFGEQDALPELDEFIRVNMPILWGQSGA